MNRFISRCASALTVSAVAFAFTATTAGATGNETPPPSNGWGSSTLSAMLGQTADVSNSTHQTSSADASSKQKNISWPVSIFSVADHGIGNDWGDGGGQGECEQPIERPRSLDTGEGDCGETGTGEGAVDQSNTATNTATSTNTNSTSQSVTQDATQDVTDHALQAVQLGSLTGSEGASSDAAGSLQQAAHPTNDTTQESSADASSKQSNVNLPVAIVSSDANNGDVDQSNTATNSASSSNANGTGQAVTQTADQTVIGGGEAVVHPAEPGEPTHPVEPATTEPTTTEPGTDPECGCDEPVDPGTGDDEDQSTEATVEQSAPVSNDTTQDSEAAASSEQTNVNLPIAVLSPNSNNGDVNQGNTATNTATSSNSNSTSQSVTQTADQEVDGSDAAAHPAVVSEPAPCGCEDEWTEGESDHSTTTGDVQQSASPSNTTTQDSSASASSHQVNINAPISILGFDANNGDVNQSNTSSNSASSANANSTGQSVTQTVMQLVG